MDLLEWMDNRSDRRTLEEKVETGRKYLPYILVGGVCIFMLIAGMLYVGMSRDIYFWDAANYWDTSRAVASGALGGDLWQKVYESIASSDYNYLAALPSAVWMKIFGQSRFSYVTGLIVMYLVPSMIMTYRLAAKLSKAPWAAYLAAVFAVPALLYAAESGFVDVGGYMIALACYNLYYSSKEKCPIQNYILIGLLLVLVVLFRRYFAFYAVSFVTAMIIDCILFHRQWRGLVTVCLTAGAVMVLGFMPFVTGILLKDYGTMYSAYKYPFMTDIKFITRYFGVLLLIPLLAVPFISGIKKKDFRPVFPCIQMVVCAAMFISTQTHDQQHLLLYMPALAVLIIFLVNLVTKRAALAALGILVLLCAVSPGIKREQPGKIQDIKTISLLPSFSNAPVVRDDVSAIVAVKRRLDDIIPEGSECRVLASSFVINDSILRNAEPSIGIRVNRNGDYIRALPDVDSRDAWRLGEIYEAEYILVATPAQTHLSPGSQTIIDEAVASFENGSDIAQIFEPVEEFNEHIGDIEMKLYHRFMDIDMIRKKEFESRLFYTVK